MSNDYLSEQVAKAVHAIYSASGNPNWLDGWESAVPNAVSELRRNIDSLSGDALLFAQEVLDLIADHEPTAATGRRGTIGAALEAMNDDERSDFKSALWHLFEQLD